MRMKLLTVVLLFALSATLAHAQTAPAAGVPAAPSSTASSSPTYSLAQVLEQAMKNGPDLQVAQFQLKAAAAVLDQAKAKNAPTVSTGAAYAHNDLINSSTPTSGTVGAPGGLSTAVNSPGEGIQGAVDLSTPQTKVTVAATQSIPDTTGPLTPKSSNFSISLSQTLYDGYPGGRANATLQQAGYTYNAAQLTYNTAVQTEVYNVEQAYYSLLGDQNTVGVDQESLNQAKENLAKTQAFFEQGNASSLDVLQSQIAARSAELSLASAQNTVNQDRQKLSELVGWPLDKQYQVAAVSAPAMPSISVDQAVATALANRNELKQLQFTRDTDQVSLKLASIENYPVVSVSGGASYRMFWSGPGSAGSWNAGVNVNLPILDSGLASAQVRQAQAQLNQVALQIEQEKQTITIAVRGNYFNVTNASNQLQLSQQNVDQAQKQYDLEKIKFGAGLASNLDVLTAFVTLVQAQVSLESARTALALAVLNFEQSMGTLAYPPAAP